MRQEALLKKKEKTKRQSNRHRKVKQLAFFAPQTLSFGGEISTSSKMTSSGLPKDISDKELKTQLIFNKDQSPNKAKPKTPPKGKRKQARPLDSRRALHLILKSSRAKGELSLKSSKNKLKIKALITQTAERCGIKIHRYVNVGNHLHLLLRFQNRELFQKFLRTITGLIARLVTGAKKGRAFGRFWDHLAFTRVVNWGKDLKNLKTYFFGNQIESDFGSNERRNFTEVIQNAEKLEEAWGNSG